MFSLIMALPQALVSHPSLRYERNVPVLCGNGIMSLLA